MASDNRTPQQKAEEKALRAEREDNADKFRRFAARQANEEPALSKAQESWQPPKEDLEFVYRVLKQHRSFESFDSEGVREIKKFDLKLQAEAWKNLHGAPAGWNRDRAGKALNFFKLHPRTLRQLNAEEYNRRTKEKGDYNQRLADEAKARREAQEKEEAEKARREAERQAKAEASRERNPRVESESVVVVLDYGQQVEAKREKLRGGAAIGWLKTAWAKQKKDRSITALTVAFFIVTIPRIVPAILMGLIMLFAAGFVYTAVQPGVQSLTGLYITSVVAAVIALPVNLFIFTLNLVSAFVGQGLLLLVSAFLTIVDGLLVYVLAPLVEAFNAITPGNPVVINEASNFDFGAWSGARFAYLAPGCGAFLAPVGCGDWVTFWGEPSQPVLSKVVWNAEGSIPEQILGAIGDGVQAVGGGIVDGVTLIFTDPGQAWQGIKDWWGETF